MYRKILVAIVLAALMILAWAGMQWAVHPTADKLFFSSVWVFGLYVVFSLLLAETLANRFSDSKTRYTFRKAVSFIFTAFVFIILLRIWVPNPQALLVAYGVVAAGIAIALQDIVKNFAGTIIIFFGGAYQVGNRICIRDTYGDVIDIGMFNTTLLEIREWIEADQATGRIVTIPNGAVLNTPVQNYTKHHKYLWDELSVVLTGDSDWQKAREMMKEIGGRHTQDFIEDANTSLSSLERYYYVEGHVLEPNTYIQPAADGYQITMRYVVNALKRRSTHSAIWTDIIVAFEGDPAIAIAPTTVATAEVPHAQR